MSKMALDGLARLSRWAVNMKSMNFIGVVSWNGKIGKYRIIDEAGDIRISYNIKENIIN